MLTDYLGLALRLLRTTRSLKQRQVAQNAGITSSMLSCYENGKKKPTLNSLEKILAAMGCDLGDLSKALRTVDPAQPPETPSRWLAAAQSQARSVAGGDDEPLSIEQIFGNSRGMTYEEKRAFEEMLQGYCRWLRTLRDARERLLEPASGFSQGGVD